MYSVYSDGELLYSPDSTILGYSFSTAVVTYEINKAGSFEFTMASTNPSYGKMSKLKSIITIEDDDEEIWRGRVLDDEKDFYNVKKTFCEGEFAFFNDVVYPPYDYSTTTTTLQQFFNDLIKYYNQNASSYRSIQPGILDVAPPETSINWKSEDYSDIMTELSKLSSSFGGYYHLRRQNGISYLDYLSELSDVSEQEIVFGENLIDLTEYIDATDVYTYMIPLGKRDENGTRLNITSVNNGQNYIFSSIGEQTFGKITKVVSWDEVDDPTTLKNNADSLLSSVIEMATTIEIRAVDLKFLGVDVDRLKVGEFVHVVSEPHGIDSNFLCSKISLDLLEPEQSEYTFGLVFDALTDIQVLDAKKADDAYKVSIETSNAFNSFSGDAQNNYATIAALNALRSEVNSALDKIENFDPGKYATKDDLENYLTPEEARDMFVTRSLLNDYLTVDDAREQYTSVSDFEELKARVDQLEEGET